MQPSEVGLLGLGLTGEVRLDLLRYIHLTPHASNELSHAGSDGRRPSIAGVRMDGRQPRTEQPSARAARRAPTRPVFPPPALAEGSVLRELG